MISNESTESTKFPIKSPQGLALEVLLYSARIITAINLIDVTEVQKLKFLNTEVPWTTVESIKVLR